jgi:hypothetical protein
VVDPMQRIPAAMPGTGEAGEAEAATAAASRCEATHWWAGMLDSTASRVRTWAAVGSSPRIVRYKVSVYVSSATISSIG